VIITRKFGATTLAIKTKRITTPHIFPHSIRTPVIATLITTILCITIMSIETVNTMTLSI
jgi:hypothetical protein